MKVAVIYNRESTNEFIGVADPRRDGSTEGPT